MPIKVTCSNCGGVLHAPDDAGGKRGRCPTCGNILPIPAPGAAAVPPPEAETPRAHHKSFSDFAMGDKSPATPVRSPEPPPRPVAEPRRQSATIPPVEEEHPGKRVPTSPFAKPAAAPKSEGDSTDSSIRAWKKARGGLWWVRTAVWLFMIPVLGLNGMRLFERIKDQPIPFSGVLNQDWLPPAQELDVAVLGIPVVLGLLCLVLGRLSFSGLPRKSGGRGLALFSALATLTAFGGLVAVLFPPVAALAQQQNPGCVSIGDWQLFIMGDTLALIQRFGLTIGFAAFLVAEFWFVNSLGRAATALENLRFGGRVTRFALLMGITAGVLLGLGLVRPATSEYETPRPGKSVDTVPPVEELPPPVPLPKKKENPKGGQPPMPKAPASPPAVLVAPRTPAIDFNESVKKTGQDVQKTVQKEWVEAVEKIESQAGESFPWPVVRPSAFLLVGLIVGMMYLRMVGAGRRAIREWLERHQPTT